jgi:Flp pilus assembly protein TadD
VQLAPDDAMAHNNLAGLFYQQGRVDEAIAEFGKTVALLPNEPKVRCNLGLLLAQRGRVKEAAQQFEAALATQPDLDVARSNLRSLAWLLATSPDASRRDGSRALELARELTALPGGETPANLGALAAAQAECGQYAPASATVQRALDLASAQAGADVTAALRGQLAIYQSGRPFRETNQNNSSNPANAR